MVISLYSREWNRQIYRMAHLTNFRYVLKEKMHPINAIFFPLITKEYRLIIQMLTCIQGVYRLALWLGHLAWENEASTFKETNKETPKFLHFCLNKFTFKPCPVLEKERIIYCTFVLPYSSIALQPHLVQLESSVSHSHDPSFWLCSPTDLRNEIS